MHLAIAIAGLLALGGGVVAGQAEQATPQANAQVITIRTDKTFTGRFVNADARDVLRFIVRSSGIEVRLSSDVADLRSTRPITLNLLGANVADVFNEVIEIADLRFEVIDEKTVVVSRK